jgi:hypothetical protein
MMNKKKLGWVAKLGEGDYNPGLLPFRFHLRQFGNEMAVDFTK